MLVHSLRVPITWQGRHGSRTLRQQTTLHGWLSLLILLYPELQPLHQCRALLKLVFPSKLTYSRYVLTSLPVGSLI